MRRPFRAFVPRGRFAIYASFYLQLAICSRNSTTKTYFQDIEKDKDMFAWNEIYNKMF